MSKQPLKKGRLAAVVDRYQSKDPQSGQEIMKNRYATIGKFTVWPSDNGSEDFSFEIDTIPIGSNGPVKGVIFFDDDQDKQTAQPQHAQPQYAPPQSGYLDQYGNPIPPQDMPRR